MSDPSKQLAASIRDLTLEFEKKNSFIRRFLMSIVTGAGTVIGATIVAGIIVMMLSNIIENNQDIPFFKQLYDYFSAQEAIP